MLRQMPFTDDRIKVEQASRLPGGKIEMDETTSETLALLSAEQILALALLCFIFSPNVVPLAIDLLEDGAFVVLARGGVGEVFSDEFDAVAFGGDNVQLEPFDLPHPFVDRCF